MLAAMLAFRANSFCNTWLAVTPADSEKLRTVAGNWSVTLPLRVTTGRAAERFCRISARRDEVLGSSSSPARRGVVVVRLRINCRASRPPSAEANSSPFPLTAAGLGPRRLSFAAGRILAGRQRGGASARSHAAGDGAGLPPSALRFCS